MDVLTLVMVRATSEPTTRASRSAAAAGRGTASAERETGAPEAVSCDHGLTDGSSRCSSCSASLRMSGENREEAEGGMTDTISS